MRVLEYTNGNRTRAAKILGIGLGTLQRKLKENGNPNHGYHGRIRAKQPCDIPPLPIEIHEQFHIPHQNMVMLYDAAKDMMRFA